MTGGDGWDIDPEGVTAVLTLIGEHIGDESLSGGIAKEADTFGTKVEEAATHTGSDPVGTALSEFFLNYKGDIAAMTGKASSAITGCGDAVTAYLDGDYTMATESQNKAGDIPPLCM